MSLTLRDKYNLKPEDEATVKAIIRQDKDPVIPRNPELPIYGRIRQPSYLLWKGEGLERNNIWTLRHLLTAYGITRRDKNGNERSKQEMIDIIRSNPQYLEDMKSPKDARLVNGFPAPERIEMDDDLTNPMAVHPPVNKKKQVKIREIPVPQPEEEEYDIIQIE
jgi:hypothetical protein